MVGDTRYMRTGMTKWHDTEDEDTPVKWEAVGSDEVKWLSVEDALDRLEGYGTPKEIARQALLAGQKVRTPFAFYSIPSVTP